MSTTTKPPLSQRYRKSAAKKSPALSNTTLRSTIPQSDVYCDGKRVSGGPTVVERVAAKGAAHRTRKSNSPTHSKPTLNRAALPPGDARMDGKRFHGEAPIYALIRARNR